MSPRPSEPPDALLLDEMFSPMVAELLVARGVECDAVAARPLLRSRDDVEVLEAALEEGRVLVTNNVVDFERLRRRRQADSRPVPGLIYTSDEGFRRDRDFIGRLAAALEPAARSHGVDASGGVLSLSPPGS